MHRQSGFPHGENRDVYSRSMMAKRDARKVTLVSSQQDN